MPGDPRECRKHAVRFTELAAEAKISALKEHFLILSKIWEGLALELERTTSLLKLTDDA
jgi:hypothetical protein